MKRIQNGLLISFAALMLLSGCAPQVKTQAPASAKKTSDIDEGSEGGLTRKEAEPEDYMAASSEGAAAKDDETGALVTEPEWMNAYREYLSDPEVSYYNRAAMIHVNDDDIPEIVLDGTSDTTAENAGYIIVTYGKGGVSAKEMAGHPGYIRYIPKKNMIASSYYHMGGMDIICSIDDGKWVTVFDGAIEDKGWGDDDELIQEFYVDKKKVSESEYNEKFNSVYGSPDAKEIVFDHSLSDMISEVEKYQTEKPQTDDDAKEETVSKRPKVEKKVRIKSASTTSYLGTTAKDGQTYEPIHAADGDYTTAWLEGKDGLGIGESITLDFDRTERITRLLIYNGFLNTKYRYMINGRVTRMLIEFNDGTTKTADVSFMNIPEEKIPFAKDEMDPTEVILDEPVTASSVKLTILDAIQGTKYQDVAVSEIEIYHEADETEADEGEDPGTEEAVKAYSEYFKAHFKPDDYGSYSAALVYLDEDEIPELMVRSNFDMGEVEVLQYAGGDIYDLGCYTYLGYVPHENDIDLSWSDGESSEDLLIKIEGHRFVTLGGVATWYDPDTDEINYYIVDANETRTATTREEYENYFKKLGKYGIYTSSDEERYYSSVEDAYRNMK